MVGGGRYPNVEFSVLAILNYTKFGGYNHRRSVRFNFEICRYVSERKRVKGVCGEAKSRLGDSTHCRPVNRAWGWGQRILYCILLRDGYSDPHQGVFNENWREGKTYYSLHFSVWKAGAKGKSESPFNATANFMDITTLCNYRATCVYRVKLDGQSKTVGLFAGRCEGMAIGQLQDASEAKQRISADEPCTDGVSM